MAFFFFGALVLSWGGFLFYVKRQRALMQSLRKAREKIEVEETRVFDFLHGLGEAFSEDIRIADLHRLIVEGAVRILDAHGGALYLFDRRSGVLLPSYMSKACPPLVEVPPHILAQSESNPKAVPSYLRVHAISPGEGLLGGAWQEKAQTLISAGDSRLSALRETTLKTSSAMISPLTYGNQALGVLAVANGPMSMQFTETDFAVFKAIAEQSAFALYNAAVYSDANEKKRLDIDLQVAQDIQRILLPSRSPETKAFEISGINVPAKQVSGDYFDYIRIDEDFWGVVIADVSGKGVPASLIMATCRSVLRGQAQNNRSAADVLHKVNRQLYPDIKEDMFISMAYVVLDSFTGRATLSRAGHDAPLLYSAKKGTISRLNPPGMAIGIDVGDVFDRVTGEISVELEQNDCLVLYTDGVSEALDAKGFEFGLNRVTEAIQASAAEGAAAVIQRLIDDLQSFAGATPQNDDITLIVIRKK
ncbi:MAG: SpoIIE family protein phosphatase [Verrucomicrobiota bacterium]|nr:SpoIIE family protein phosphatase [Verrucomicrobiota bacterium]